MSDLMDEKVYLISSAEEGSICIVTLMLTGRATPNLHNGIVNIGDEQHYVSVYDILLEKIAVSIIVYVVTLRRVLNLNHLHRLYRITGF